MSKQTSLFSIAQTLQHHDLFAFNSRTFAAMFNLNAVQAARLLTRMENEGLVERVERGKYLLLGLTPEKVLANPLFIGSQLVTPGYISFWSALHFYSFTEQVPRTVFIATTRKKPSLTYRGTPYQFVQIAPDQFFGYQREMVGELPIVVADEAKALLDSLFRPQYAGGVGEVAKALLAARDQLDVETLVDYANRMGSRSLGSRLGYLLQQIGIEAEGLEISHGPVNLEPDQPRGGPFDATWQVYANLSPEALFPEGVG